MKYLTITIPSYNSEQYLERCLDSLILPRGWMEHIEIIVVNDGSTDRTGEIADDYVRRFPDTVRVVHKENGGHGSGVNTGLALATGRYFKVLDSDDWFDERAYRKLVENLEDWLGKEIEVRVITVDEEKERLVLSARDILREKEREEKKARISNVQIGLVTEGTVETLQPYGAFIDLGNGLSGLVHVSQISEKRIKSPASVLNVGDKVKVKVINIKDGKLSLSMKALNEIAAEEIEEESYDLPQSDGLTTSLGSLFANIKL